MLCYVGIPREKNNQVSSMINFVRNIGGSIGIALGQHVGDADHAVRQRLSVGATCRTAIRDFARWSTGLTATLRAKVGAADATHQAYGRIAMMMQQQASALAYRDVVSILAVVVACLIPLAFIMQRPAKSTAGEAPPPH